MSVGEIIAIIIIAIIIILIEWTLGLYLWQSIAVAIFGLPSLNAMQFAGLWVLIMILFGDRGANIQRVEEK